MGTNVNTNLFTAAPAAPQANVQQKNVNTAFEGRKASTGRQGKDFSSELKDVTKDATKDATKDVIKDDKLDQAVKEAVENPVDEKAVQKNSEKVDTNTDADAKEAVAEVVDEATEEIAAEAMATTVVQLPLAELTASVKPVQTEAASEQQVQQMAQVDTTAPEISAAAQELQQPTAATQLQQQSIQTEAKAQDTAKTNVVVNDTVVAEAEAQPMAQSENAQPQVNQPEMHQPKSIEALLKPVQPVEKVTAPDGSQVVNSGDMTKEQQMLAVLSGRVVAQDTKAVETAPQKTTVEDMNNLIGQQTQVVTGNGAKQGLNPDGQQQNFQQSQQNFSQNQAGVQQEAESMAIPQAQPAESEDTTFTNRMDAVQAANVSNVQTQTADNPVQLPGQQNVSQTRADYQINQQIVEQARLLRNAENTEMVIKLNPRHLGDLTLKVAVNSNGGVTATFHTDNAQVRAMLETSMIQLQKELNEQGIKVDSVEVQTGLSDGQLPEGQSQGYYQQQQEQQNVRSQQIDLKDFEDDVENLAAEPVNKATEVIRDSEGNKISDGVDYAV